MFQAGRHSALLNSTRIRISAKDGRNVWIQRLVSTASVGRAMHIIAFKHTVTTSTRPVPESQSSLLTPPPTHTRSYSTRAERRKAYVAPLRAKKTARADISDAAYRARRLADDFWPTPEPRYTRTLHVGNLPPGTTALQLEGLFPAVERAQLFKQCADVLFTSAEAAREVLLRHIDTPWHLWPSTLILHRPVEAVHMQKAERGRAESRGTVPGIALLYVYGFGERTTKEDLETLFHRYGPVLALRISNKHGWAEVAYRADQVHVDRIVRGNLAQPLVVRGGILTIERRTFLGDSWVPIPADLDAHVPSHIEEGASLNQAPDEIEEGERARTQTHEDPEVQAKLEERRKGRLAKRKMEDFEAAAAARQRAPRRTVEHVRHEWLMSLDDKAGESDLGERQGDAPGETDWEERQGDVPEEERDGETKPARKTLKPLTERFGAP